ncbi:tetratricopeptide repeat protein [Frigoriglobus tundricola]|uniref:Uncharacterized protein n=1 Tax=Frigoriglobus tundricola TaxID=2774151 RepID=A0A6M5YWR6_9BACT|nr:hypothetical protein [Frigoriglobus tundricola]QJW97653.1 hypothetical protein FTUN_5230 [Frigoriglobus tundricola]
MRAMVLFTASVTLLWGAAAWSQPAPQGDKKDAKADPPSAAMEPLTLTPAAERTRTKALKAKVSVNFTEKRLGDVLKEFATQADVSADALLMWAYGPDFPYSKSVSYTCKGKALDVALDELFKKNGDLGYIVVSKEGDKHDGWVLLTTTGERGAAKPAVKLGAKDEADAAEKLALAKTLIDGGKTDQAKTVLAFVLKKYPTAKIAAEAKELLTKLEK